VVSFDTRLTRPPRARRRPSTRRTYWSWRTRISSASLSSRTGRTFPRKRRGAWMMRTRRVLFGLAERSRLLVAMFTERREVIRLISVRTATRRERRDYEEDKRQRDSAG